MVDEHGYDANIVAGGTGLVLMMSHGFLQPSALISLARIAGIGGIRANGESVQIGAMTTIRDAAISSDIRASYPALAEAFAAVGNVRVRNQATVGGNLAHADYASDPPTMLVALGASVSVVGVRGARSIPVADLVLGPYSTSLEATEIISAITLPLLEPETRMSYRRITAKSREDRPCVVIGVVARMEGAVCRTLRIAVGAACNAPTLIERIPIGKEGEELTDGLMNDIADLCVSQIDLLDDVRASAWYRGRLLRVTVLQMLGEVRDGRG